MALCPGPFPAQMLLVKDPELVSCADLLVPRVGELCGGSLREYDHEALKERLGRQYLPIKQRNSGEKLCWFLPLGLGIQRENGRAALKERLESHY